MRILERLAPHVHWGLRLSLSATFLYHGLGKYPVAEWAVNNGLPVPVVWAVVLAEVFAGIALIVGAFGRELLTRLAGAVVIVIMIGAIGLVHLPNGFSFTNNGFEFQLSMLLTGLYFVARGNKV